MRNRCFSQKGQRQGPNRTASQRALVSCVTMWYTNGLGQNIALLSPFKLTVLHSSKLMRAMQCIEAEMSVWMTLDIYFNWSTVEDSQYHIYFLYNTNQDVDNSLCFDFIFSFSQLILINKFILWREPTISAESVIPYFGILRQKAGACTEELFSTALLHDSHKNFEN